MGEKESLSSSLRNVVDLSDENVEYLRERVLEEVSVPEGWEVFGEPELQTDGETWTLVSFMSEEDEYRYIELLPGSNSLQVWDEESGPVGEPTWSAEEVEEALFS